MLVGSVMSSSTASMPGWAAITASRWPRRRPAMITLLPSLCRASASPRPMPEPPPVMKMVLPESFIARDLGCGGRSFREPVAEHRQATDGGRLVGLVLDDVPVLGQAAVFDADDVE